MNGKTGCAYVSEPMWGRGRPLEVGREAVVARGLPTGQARRILRALRRELHARQRQTRRRLRRELAAGRRRSRRQARRAGSGPAAAARRP